MCILSGIHSRPCTSSIRQVATKKAANLLFLKSILLVMPSSSNGDIAYQRPIGDQSDTLLPVRSISSQTCHSFVVSYLPHIHMCALAAS